MGYLVRVLIIMGMVNMAGCASKNSFETYNAKDPEINAVVDYIAGWRAREQKGASGSFSQVVFTEPEPDGKTLLASMTLTIKPEEKTGFSPKTADGAFEELKQRRSQFDGMKVLSFSKRTVQGTEAVEAVFSYNALDLPQSVKAKLVPTRERVLVLKKGTRFYFLRYENFASDFEKYDEAFSRVIKSVRIK